MDTLRIKTKYDFETFKYFDIIMGSHYSQIELKNRKIILFEKLHSKNIISILNQNIRLKKIFECDDDHGTHIMKVIQLSNNKILFCSKDLFVLNIKSNEIKKIEFPEEKVIDIIKLKNKKILGITTNHLININFKGGECQISNISDVPQNSFSKENFRGEFLKQYLDLYELANNKLLIHSHSNGLAPRTPTICGNSCPEEYLFNKIYILDLADSSYIYNFDNFENLKTEINIVILDKYICISHYNIIDIYDINNFKLLKQIDDKINKKYIIKYDENLIIGLSHKRDENNIIVYNLSNINEISFKIYYGNFEFQKMIMHGYTLNFCKKKSLAKLQNGSLLIICYGRLFLVEFPDEIKYSKFKPLVT